MPIEAITELPENFIALLKNDNDVNPFLVRRKKDYFVVVNQDLEKQKMSFDKLKEVWNSVIIVIETKEQEENPNKLKKEYLLFCILLLSSIIPSIINFNKYSILFNVFTFIGFLISYLIIKGTFGMNNKRINKFCSSVSKNQGCSNVINNTKSKLFNIISLSDACIVYFSSILLFSIFVEFNVSLLFLISICSILVMIYSLYYQAFIIKDWCALCIGISGILIIQFLILLYNFDYFIFELSIISKAIIIVTFIFTLWHTIKDIQIKNINLESTKFDFIKFKRNKNLFNELLSKKKLINNDVLLDSDRIFFGSKKPKLVIIAITNPLCGFCAESFQTYYEIVNKYEDVQINFIFSLFTNDPNNPAYKILYSFLELYKRKSKKEAIEALKEWFDYKDFNNWIKKHKQIVAQNQYIDAILKSHLDWTIQNKIHQTPTTIINNYYYPNEYNINDIFYFIDDMLLENKT
ncbi:vitamin K epoxide reductase family protein [Flavobacterium sp.]|uniref:vitamin K epoxide reductase family protein n=1 Tax=Flavobacterium sp. TaxID=239 RepID=UPI00286BDDFC|nr:vitamin K epoxide reductase family protein [Flavobacterium sp.]